LQNRAQYAMTRYPSVAALVRWAIPPSQQHILTWPQRCSWQLTMELECQSGQTEVGAAKTRSFLSTLELENGRWWPFTSVWRPTVRIQNMTPLGLRASANHVVGCHIIAALGPLKPGLCGVLVVASSRYIASSKWSWTYWLGACRASKRRTKRKFQTSMRLVVSYYAKEYLSVVIVFTFLRVDFFFSLSLYPLLCFFLTNDQFHVAPINSDVSRLSKEWIITEIASMCEFYVFKFAKALRLPKISKAHSTRVSDPLWFFPICLRRTYRPLYCRVTRYVTIELFWTRSLLSSRQSTWSQYNPSDDTSTIHDFGLFPGIVPDLIV
jgi:hypothetical protein